MDIKSLEGLKRNGKVFELLTVVISDNIQYNVYEFQCEQKHAMRIDLISFDMFGDVNHADIICSLNSIINPLTIDYGDILYFIDKEEIEIVRSDKGIIKNILEGIKGANKGKEQKNDKNRQKDVSNRQKTEKDKTYLPPNILDVNQSNIVVENGFIKFKPNF